MGFLRQTCNISLYSLESHTKILVFFHLQLYGKPQHLFIFKTIHLMCRVYIVLLDFSLTVKAATLIFISGRGSASSSAKEGKSGFIYNLVKS